MKLRELVYSNLKEIQQNRLGRNNSELLQVAFTDIKWSCKEEAFHNFNKKDPYSLLYTNTQKDVWQKACNLREKPKKPKTFPEPPAEVLRREWQQALVDLTKDHETRQKYSAKHNPIDYKKVVVNAFKEIAWNVPKQTFDCLHVTSINHLMEPTTQRHFWYAGCKAMNKMRDFYLTTGRDQPDYEQELLAPGISKYTSLPITLDDKVDITQLRYDYQKKHQISPIVIPRLVATHQREQPYDNGRQTTGRSDYPQHREAERRNTRHRSPSPPHPGSFKPQREIKPARRKAPNGENLFHYKLWKQLDISRPPRFTSEQLSA